MVFINNMDKLEQKEMKKIRPIKNIWYGWLINCIPEPIRTSVGDFKGKIVNCKTNISNQTVYGRGKKLCKPKAQNRTPFILKKKRMKAKTE